MVIYYKNLQDICLMCGYQIFGPLLLMLLHDLVALATQAKITTFF